MPLTAPFAGTLEWRVEEGAQVTQTQVIAWIAVKDHCALRPLIAPSPGRVCWRRSEELAHVEAGEPIALLRDDPPALAECLAAEHRAAQFLLAQLLGDRTAMEERLASTLHHELLRGEVAVADRRMARIRQRWP